MLALLLLRGETFKLFTLLQKPHEHRGGLQGRGASDIPHAPGKKRERERERVETLNALTQAVDNLPLDTLPAAQEAAMRLVRRVAARTPETWWHLDRHHGLGDIRSTVRMRSPTSPVSSDSGDSHRRRRMLAVHSKTL